MVEQIYDKNMKYLEKEISQLVVQLKIRRKYDQMLETNKKLTAMLSDLMATYAEKTEHAQHASRHFRLGKIYSVRSALNILGDE